MGERWSELLADEAAPIYPVGVVAELLDVDVQVIRRYDEAGLVTPRRSRSGQRRYSRQDIARLAHVLELARDGLNIKAIARIFELEERVRALEDRPPDRSRQGRA